MNIFEEADLKLKKIGRLKTKTSLEIKKSRLSVGFETLDREMFKPEPCYDYVEKLGVKYARVQTMWKRCETQKGKLDFRELDKVVDKLISIGVEPWFNLTYGNPIYMEKDLPNEAAVGCIPTLYGDECEKAWFNYVAELTKHYKGRIKLWEIWNEPNISNFWYPSTAHGAKYAEFLKQTVPYIRENDSDAVISGCSAGVDNEFLYDALKAGIGEHIDCFSFHPYSAIPEYNYFGSLASVRRMLKKYAPHVKLMQGECGYPSQATGHHDKYLVKFNATETTQAKYVLRRVTLDSLADMELISYFHITDLMENVYVQSSGEKRPPVILGLLHGKTYVPKESYYAMQNICNILDGEADLLEGLFFEGWMGDYNRRAMGAIPSLAIIHGSFERRGYPVYTWYYPESLEHEWHGNNTFEIKIVNDEDTENRIEHPVVIDCINGGVYEPTEYSDNDAGRLGINSDRHCLFHGLPLTDYPLFLTDLNAVDVDLD